MWYREIERLILDVLVKGGIGGARYHPYEFHKREKRSICRSYARIRGVLLVQCTTHMNDNHEKMYMFMYIIVRNALCFCTVPNTIVASKSFCDVFFQVIRCGMVVQAGGVWQCLCTELSSYSFSWFYQILKREQCWCTVLVCMSKITMIWE